MAEPEERVATAIVDTAIKIHVAMGPGLLESVYERILATELRKQGYSVTRQASVPVYWDGEKIDDAFRADLIIDNLVLIELKAVEQLSRVHFKQTKTYLKVANLRLGFLLNFGESLMKNGIHRIANGMPD